LSYLWRVSADGAGTPQRLEIAGPSVFFPSVSLSGIRLIFSRDLTNSDIWRYEMGHSAEPLITSSLDDNNAQFSPTGKRIAFASSRSGEAMEIWVADADGSRPTQMTNLLGRHQGTPRWSPDSRWIAFDSQSQEGKWHVYVMDSKSGRPRRITTDDLDAHAPSWSRDNSWIYLRSARTGRNEIWRAAFDGGKAEQVTRDGGFSAYESVDGETLFYIKASDSPLFARALSGGPERQILPFVSFRAFVPVEDGIYFIGQRDASRYPLEFFQFSTGTTRVLTNIDGGVDLGLSVSPKSQANSLQQNRRRRGRPDDDREFPVAATWRRHW
jgi:Tol biopolymer transport system component